MTLAYKTTHDTEALARLIEQFKELPNIAALINAYTEQTQDDEDVFWDLLLERALSTAIGAQLDGLGEIVGEERLGRSDDDYRLAITARIKRNVMSGTGDEILEILALLTDNVFTLEEFFPAGLKIVIYDALSEDPEQIARNLSKAAGVRASLEYSLYDDDETFTFADADVDQFSVEQGFAGVPESLVAVGSQDATDAHVVSSNDGSSWNERTNPKAVALYDVAYSEERGQYLAVGGPDGADSYILSSFNGLDWDEQSNPVNTSLNGAAWSPELLLWCVVGNNGTIITSPDGLSWTQRTSPKAVNLNDITWADSLGLYIAVGDADGSDALIITSPNGEDWSEQTNPKNVNLNGIAWSSSLSLLIAVGDDDGGGDSYMLSSANAINWSERSNPTNDGLLGIDWSESVGRFCAVGDKGTSYAYIITSSSGFFWTQRSNPKNRFLSNVVWSDELTLFCAAGENDGASAYVVTSPTGTTWTLQTTPNNPSLRGVAASNGQFAGGYWADAILIR